MVIPFTFTISAMGIGMPHCELGWEVPINYSAEVIVTDNEKQESNRKGISGLVFVGCLMIGLAVGFVTGNIVAGLFGGLGVGFIAMAIVRYKVGEW
jgi:hypothetical protein